MPSWGAVGLSERILGSRLLVLEDGGHLQFGEHPEVETAVKELLLSIQTEPRRRR